MATKSKSTAKKTTRTKKETTSLETGRVPGYSSVIENLKRTGRAKWIVLTLVVVGLGLVLANKYLVAGWVNNKPITRFELNSALNQRYGKDMLEELIVEKLINEEAQKRGVSVTQEEINQEIKKAEDQQGGTDKLNQLLGANNISRDDFGKLVRLQLLRQKMFGSGVNISDDDVKKYLEENKDSLDLESRTASEQAKLKDSITDQLRNQQINQEFNKWLTETLQGPTVKRN